MSSAKAALESDTRVSHIFFFFSLIYFTFILYLSVFQMFLIVSITCINFWA
jgi:hypothetical protein